VIVLDANILVSAILGSHTQDVMERARERGIRLAATERQFAEARRVLTGKLRMAAERAEGLLDGVLQSVELLAEPSFAAFEGAARERLHARGQSDWPLVAAAMAFGAGIWSTDRDLFGVGLPVWSTRNMAFAEPAAP